MPSQEHSILASSHLCYSIGAYVTVRKVEGDCEVSNRVATTAVGLMAGYRAIPISREKITG